MSGSKTMQAVDFDAALISTYDTTGPRYTSYPTVAEFRDDFGPDDLRRHIERIDASNPGEPLSLYLHIPFCDTVCYYCACNKVVTKNRDRADEYLRRLFREIVMVGELFTRERRVVQLHWGGGTPTYLSTTQMRALMDHTRKYFQLLDDDLGEYGIEIDPRRLAAGTVEVLREIGFNRLSMGVQDLNPAVQEAVNRIQPAELTFGVLEQARGLGFRSISVDLMYGLPRQTPASFEQTLHAMIEAGPDRLSVFNYAHLPHRFKTQRQIREEELPSPAQKLEILQRTIELLLDAGYVYIGMDHFARKDDELAVALEKGTLRRNFQGYSTHSECELVALGSSAISLIGDCYAQNTRRVEDYQRLIDAGDLATTRGITLTADDRIRRDVISDLMCRFSLKFNEIESKHGLAFERYFMEELKDLEPMAADGLVRTDRESITVTPKGRLLIRNICMVFDAYRRASQPGRQFSKVI